ncbi:hypothetical protein BBJ28_00018399 [Nothophytophthora sp. Chile5]|nr:hypothetical protein BBJ28_00018399 [Nothophytophthora sp. Chile5]
MELARVRAGSRMRVNSNGDNQQTCEDAPALSAASAGAASPQERGHEILLQLLTQITEFLERKEMMSTRVAASKEWRKSRSRRRQTENNNNLFEVVIQVCEQRMRRLKRASSIVRAVFLCQTSGGYGGRDREEWSAQPPRVLVAEAIVQELLVSLMELRMKEKESLVMDEVENVEVMRQLHVHLQKDEKMVRNRVCVGAGDEQQLEELQLMLRTDFLHEVGCADSPQKPQQDDAAASNEASLQFAWETINDQKKEIIRLRAENEELKRSDSISMASSALGASFSSDEPAKAINLLRSQLSSHHDKNLDVLRDHIHRLEKALQRATSKARSGRGGRDASASTFDSSRGSEKNDWSALLSRSAVGTDFSRTQLVRQKCDECRKISASLLTLRTEIKQLRAHATTDEESLLHAEKERTQLQRENSALSSTLLSAKQKQEELRQMILDLTHEKHQLQNLSDSEQRTSESSIRLLNEQLGALEEQRSHHKQKFDDLVCRFDSETSAKRTLAKKYTDLQDEHNRLSQSASELQEQVASLERAIDNAEAIIEEKQLALNDLGAKFDSIERDSSSHSNELREKETLLANSQTQLSELHRHIKNFELDQQKTAGENERLVQTLAECERRNQRLESGLEELKQGKQLLESLQQVKRETSVLQQSELQQAQEQIGSLKLQLTATEAECARLEEAMEEAHKTYCKEVEGNKFARMEAERLRCELAETVQTRKALEQQVSAQMALQKTPESAEDASCQSSGNLEERIADLFQELAESKTTILMWMSKYNAACEDKQRLEGDVQGLSEEQYSLQRQIEELQSACEASALAEKMNIRSEVQEKVSQATRTVTDEFKAKLAQLEAKNLELQGEVDQLHAYLAERSAATANEVKARRETSHLKEQHQNMERERRVQEQEKKALTKLVQTLQARPELQQRAFREMLLSCQRGTEHTFCQLSERVLITMNKLSVVEQRYEALKTRVLCRTQSPDPTTADALNSGSLETNTSIIRGSGQIATSNVRVASPQIIVQDDFSGSSSLPFNLPGSQPPWLEALTPLDEPPTCCTRENSRSLCHHDQDTRTSPQLVKSLMLWKWKFFAQGLKESSRKQEVADLSRQLEEVAHSNEQLKATSNCLKWSKLKVTLERQQLNNQQRIGAVRFLRLAMELQMAQQTRRFATWRHLVESQKHEAQLNSAKEKVHSTLSPETAKALGNCIELLRQFCEAAPKDETAVVAVGGLKVTSTRGVELTSYLVEINNKISVWKLTMDRRIREFAERNNQLRSLQTRCSELKDLVALNQRLIEEMERRAAGQQSIMEAAWDFAAAYRALAPAVRAQVFQSRDFLSASKGIVEGLNSLGLPRSVHNLSQTQGVDRNQPPNEVRGASKSTRNVTFLSASAAPGISHASNAHLRVAKDNSRKEVDNSNIELLEGAVGSLKDAMGKQRKLQQALKEKDLSLATTLKELEKRNLQFVVLRSFLQWKGATSFFRGRARTSGRYRPQPINSLANAKA